MKKWNEISPFTGSSIGEDAPTNAAGTGSIAGLGVGPMGEPGVDPKKKKRRQPLIDGRSKAYRQHRERLEKARIKRQESKKNRGDFVESIVSEMTYGVGSLPAMRPQADMANINSAKSATGYEIYHKTFSAAMQHAYRAARKMGYIVDSDDIDSKVASGPKKPSSGKTNKYILGTNKKQNLHVQVANLDNKRYELNMYVD
tara:strand:+ start:99 stop:698 length:600 start_codon:yes stop_codon:yes gene_type:complete